MTPGWMGTRTDPASPISSENGVDLDLDGDLESAWYRGGAGTDQAFLEPVGPGGPLRPRSDAEPHPAVLGDDVLRRPKRIR